MGILRYSGWLVENFAGYLDISRYYYYICLMADTETILLRVPKGGRKELDRKRANAGCRSVNEYCNAILFSGKVNHKKPK